MNGNHSYGYNLVLLVYCCCRNSKTLVDGLYLQLIYIPGSCKKHVFLPFWAGAEIDPLDIGVFVTILLYCQYLKYKMIHNSNAYFI